MPDQFDAVDTLGNVDYLHAIIKYLSLPEVVRLSSTCSTIRAVVKGDDERLRHIRREINAARQVVERFGYSHDHLDLLRQYIRAGCLGNMGAMDAFRWLRRSSSWQVFAEGAQLNAEKLQTSYEKLESPIWVQSWEVQCTDASRQRALVANPRERVRCMVDYCGGKLMLIELHEPRTVLAELPTLDRISPCNFSFIAPEAPGLYMIRVRSSRRPFRMEPEDFQPQFLAWLKVDQSVVPKPQGRAVYLQIDD